MLVNIATEDVLSEAIAVRLIDRSFGRGRVGNRLGRKGNGYLISKLPNFRQMAIREPVLILTDLDDTNCAPSLLDRWAAGHPFPENLLLRVAVREAEAWLLADRLGVAELLGISPNKIPRNPEILDDPKQFFLNIAHRAKREIRSELISSRGSVARQGLGYNRVLSDFVNSTWGLDSAIEASESLCKAVLRLDELAERIAD